MGIAGQVELIRENLKREQDFPYNKIDLSLPVIPPFIGKEEIKLIIIGQDPTVLKETSRKNIRVTLNLNKNNALTTYIKNIYNRVGVSLQNVYATNLFKYFYTIPPAGTIEVLKKHLESNLNLLMVELAAFKTQPIITLGEPVLRLLMDEKAKVRYYWGYEKKTRKSNSHFKYSQSKENKLKRDFFPFPHQPSLRFEFYKNNLGQYLFYMKNCQSVNYDK
jgi:hypothetical protein